MSVVETIQCSVCGDAAPAGTSGYSSEGPACARCASAFAAAGSKKLSPPSVVALIVALLPLAFGQSLTIWTAPHGIRREESMRLFFIRTTAVTEANTGEVAITVDPAAVRTHSDPVALFGGPVAMLVGALALALAMRTTPRPTRAIVVSVIALVLGGYSLLRGLGKL